MRSLVFIQFFTPKFKVIEIIQVLVTWVEKLNESRALYSKIFRNSETVHDPPETVHDPPETNHDLPEKG